jgi:hypothetical protein
LIETFALDEGMPDRAIQLIVAPAIQSDVEYDSPNISLLWFLEDSREIYGDGFAARFVEDFVVLNVKHVFAGQIYVPIVFVAVLQPERGSVLR